jgi:exosortase/archaeosortase
MVEYCEKQLFSTMNTNHIKTTLTYFAGAIWLAFAASTLGFNLVFIDITTTLMNIMTGIAVIATVINLFFWHSEIECKEKQGKKGQALLLSLACVVIVVLSLFFGRYVGETLRIERKCNIANGITKAVRNVEHKSSLEKLINH